MGSPQEEKGLTFAVEYTPRTDWGAGGEAGDPIFAKWVAKDPDPVADLRAARKLIGNPSPLSVPVLILPGGKRLVDPTLEQGIMAITGCTEAEASAYVDAFWRERLAGCGEIKEEE